MKLHIGTGRNYLPNWTNCDIFSNVPQADVYADMTALPFPRESFDTIYASHVLEHSHRHMVLATLTHWRDMLKTGGVLRIAVPNFSAIVAWYNHTSDLESLVGLLYGGQNHPKNHHFICFDKCTLTRDLKRVGFETVREWDWRETEHAKYDDYSQAYLPHLDKSGFHVSLNLEAVK